MADFNAVSTISLTCPLHLEKFLKQELLELGYEPKNFRPAGMEIEGTLIDCMRLNLNLRYAHRVHYLVKQIPARNDRELYRELKKIPWEEYISATGYVSVTSSVDQKGIRNSQFANVKCKDGIVDRIREQTGSRPNSGSRLDGSVIFLFWRHNKARLFLDTSGESLSRRGYRVQNHTAPLQETLASAIIKKTGWTASKPLVDPMCGSGTLVIEAALMALNKPAGLLRPHFGFKEILGYDDSVWQKMRTHIKSSISDENLTIIASDRDPKAVRAARKNAQTAGVDQYIKFKTVDFRDLELPKEHGVLVMNPPYGERLDDTSSLEPFYTSIGDFLKQKCTGWTGFVFTGNQELAKKIGLRTSSKTPFYNSTIECRLLEYEIY